MRVSVDSFQFLISEHLDCTHNLHHEGRRSLRPHPRRRDERPRRGPDVQPRPARTRGCSRQPGVRSSRLRVRCPAPAQGQHHDDDGHDDDDDGHYDANDDNDGHVDDDDNDGHDDDDGHDDEDGHDDTDSDLRISVLT